MGLLDKVKFTEFQYKPYFKFWENFIEQYSGGFSFLQKSRNASGEKSFQALRHRLSNENVDRISKLVGDSDVGTFVVLFSLFSILIKKYSGKQFITLHSPLCKISSDEDIYAHIVPIFIDADDHRSLKVHLSNCQTAIREAYKYQNFPRELIFENREGFFDSNILLKSPTVHFGHKDDNNHDLVLEISRTDDGIDVSYRFNVKAFDAWFIGNIHTHLQALAVTLDAMDVPVSDLEIISRDEKRKLLEEFNGKQSTLAEAGLVHEMFERQVMCNPDRIAVVFRDISLTYQNLNDEANSLAHHLKSYYGLRQGDIVGVELEKSEKLVVAILGILKAGAAYLPIDRNYPAERKAYIMHDAGIKLLLIDGSNFLDVAGYYTGNVFVLDPALAPIEANAQNLPGSNTAQGSAYVIYTSGTTGRPKGVMVDHGSNVNMAVDQVRQFEICSEDRVLQFASPSFDASISEMCMALFAGASLIIPHAGNDAQRFMEDLRLMGVSVVTLPPSFLAVLSLDRLRSLRVLITAGEAALVKDAVYCSQFTNYYNAYGPTECAVCVSIYKVASDRDYESTVPIGFPIANMRVYILSEDLKLLPMGVAGEICVSGKGVSRGYLNAVESTDEKFVEDPFIKGEKMYRTGDVGRWLLNGAIEFVGRKDAQVKVRGYRIEVREIETVLLRHEETKDAIVEVVEDGTGDKQIVAYIISARAEAHASEMRAHAGRYLPNYMIPSRFVFLRSFPLTIHGKVDRNALRELRQEQQWGEEERIAPRNRFELQIANIWRQVLDIETVGVTDNFFSIGGHSLKAIQIVSRISSEMNIRIELSGLFANPTIEKLASFIGTSVRTPGEHISFLEEQEHYPVSHAQKRLWILQQLKGSQQAYNLPAVYQGRGQLDVKTVEMSFRYLLSRHEILRTNFFALEGELRQKVSDIDVSLFRINVIDRSSDPDAETVVQRIVKDQIGDKFDFDDGLLLKVSVVQLASDRWAIILIINHIISDGWSMDVLLKEWLGIYQAYRLGNAPRLPALKLQYKDYTAWHLRQTEGDLLNAHREYWLNQFNGEVPVLEFPTDFTRPAFRTFVGDSVELVFAPETSERLRALSNAHEASLFMTLLAILKVLLYKYTGQADLIIGCPATARDNVELEGQIGFYVNTLALRTRLSGDDRFSELLRKVKQTCLDAYDHQAYPFDKLIEELNLKNDISRSPLFDIMVSWERLDGAHQGGASAEDKAPTVAGSKFDLLVLFIDAGREIIVKFIYNVDLFSGPRMQGMAQHYRCLTESLLSHGQKTLDALEYFPSSERYKVLTEFNRTEADYPVDKTIHQLFEEQVARTPDNIALVYEGGRLTYQQLNDRSNALARYIRTQFHARTKQELAPDTTVALYLDRSLEMVVGMLAVLKAGGAYVPIDPDCPQERVRYILQDTSAALVLTQAHLAQKSGDQFAGSKTVCIDLAEPLYQWESASDLKQYSTASDLMYVIYTSGTTGQPKGVMVEHRGVHNTIHHLCTIYEKGIKATAYTSYVFDVSVSEIFTSLLQGLELHILSNHVRVDCAALSDYLIDHKITLAYLPPVILARLPQRTYRDLRTIIYAGEPCDEQTAGKWSPVVRLFNYYGPTECSIYATARQIMAREVGQIGQPIQNTRAYVLDAHREPVPIGTIGELYLGGAGVARGYLNNKDLTAARFISNPFAREGDQTYRRLYKTGDLVRWLSDGNLEYIGRNDSQVKIRGYRIELGEIEHHLSKCEGVASATVITKHEITGENFLCAFFVSDKKARTDSEALRRSLANRLPNYMIPACIVELPEFPLTDTGKTDRKALASFELPVMTADRYVAPRNDIEVKLVEIWQELLNRKPIGIEHNFFELGGHSLKAIQIVSRIYREMNIRTDLKCLFTNPTIKALAKEINASKVSRYERIHPFEEQEYYEVSNSQKRLWVLSQFEENRAAYNVPGIFEFKGDLNLLALKAVIEALVSRHESLRTSFITVQGAPKQRVLDMSAVNLDLNCEDLRGVTHNESMLESLIADEIRSSFDLAHGPLFKAKIFWVRDDSWTFLLTMHHVVSDAWSIEVLMKELVVLYNAFKHGAGNPLPPLSIQYKDYTRWMLQRQAEENSAGLREYWLKQLGDEIPELELPYDYPRPATTGNAGGSTCFVLDKSLRDSLSKMAEEQEASLFMVLLATIYAFLYKYTNQKDFIVGTPIAGRTHPDLEGQIGNYLNTLALKVRLKNDETFLSLLAEVKKITLEAFAYQLYPFDEIVSSLDYDKGKGQRQLFNIEVEMVSLNDESQAEGGVLEGIEVQGRRSSHVLCKEDLSFRFILGEQLLCAVKYKTDLFEESTVVRFMDNYQILLSSIIQDPSNALDELEYLTEAERLRILTISNTVLE